MRGYAQRYTYQARRVALSSLIHRGSLYPTNRVNHRVPGCVSMNRPGFPGDSDLH